MRLRSEFLQCRDAWHVRDVEVVAGKSSQQLLKVRPRPARRRPLLLSLPRTVWNRPPSYPHPS